MVDVGSGPGGDDGEPVVTPKSSRVAPVELRRLSKRDRAQAADIRRVLLVSDVQLEAAVGRPPSKKDIDDEWRLDIWRSYVLKDCRPPSPFGYKWAPAAPKRSLSTSCPLPRHRR